MHAMCLGFLNGSLQAPEGIDVDRRGLPAGDVGGHQGEPAGGWVGGDLDLKISSRDIGAHLGVEVAFGIKQAVDRNGLQSADDGGFDVGGEPFQRCLWRLGRCLVIVDRIGIGLQTCRVERAAAKSGVDRGIAQLGRTSSKAQQAQGQRGQPEAGRSFFHKALFGRVLSSPARLGQVRVFEKQAVHFDFGYAGKRNVHRFGAHGQQRAPVAGHAPAKQDNIRGDDQYF